MKKLVLLVSFFVVSALFVNAQRNPPPAPTPNENQINVDRQKDISGRSDNLRMTEKFPVHTSVNSKIFRESIRPLYRDLKKDEKALLAPNSEDSQKFVQFLNEKQTGLIKLIADQGCDKQFAVVITSPHCDKYSMPGTATSYSFREETYRIKDLGDLFFTGEQFQSVGDLIQGIFLNIGDIPLESVDLTTNEVSALMAITTPEDLGKADEMTRKLFSDEGLKNGEYTFRGNVPVAENNSYILRSIAYRGNKYRTLQGMTYDEFEFDKRREIVVVFRVVRLEGKESATVLWKELANEKSPKLKVPDDKN